MVSMLQPQWRCAWPPFVCTTPLLLRSRAPARVSPRRALAADRWSSAGGKCPFRLPGSAFATTCSSTTLLRPFDTGAKSTCRKQAANPRCWTWKLVPYLLLGLGAFLAFNSPAHALHGGGAAAVLQGATIPEIINSGWAGLMAGCLHTLTGPDHLAALAPLCVGRGKMESAVVGALWGCGHDAGQILFGLLFLLLKGKLKIEVLQVWASRVVGITLLAIGVAGLKEAQEVPISVLAAESTGASPPPPPSPPIDEGRKFTHRFRTFATGIIYGLQPDALITILPALALPSRLAGAAYLFMFLLGTIVAMGSYTAFIGSCGQALQNRLPGITRRLTVISSVIAIFFGMGVLLGELLGVNLFH